MDEKDIRSLVFEVQSGNDAAFDELSVVYEPLLTSLCGAFVKKFSTLCLEDDDVRQEALIALYNATRKYSFDKSVSFGAYAKVCVNNRLISYVRKQYSKQKSKKLSQKEYIAPQAKLLDTQNAEKLMDFAEKRLTSLEKRVFEKYLQKLPYTVIAQQLSISEKSVDNAIYRIKAKLKKFL